MQVDGCVLSRKGEAMVKNNYYYVNNDPQPGSGEHEVHKASCIWLALARSRTFLGYCSDCEEAIAKAKTIFRQVNGCAYCCKEYHRA